MDIVDAKDVIDPPGSDGNSAHGLILPVPLEVESSCAPLGSDPHRTPSKQILWMVSAVATVLVCCVAARHVMPLGHVPPERTIPVLSLASTSNAVAVRIAANQFGLAMLASLHNTTGDTNVFISPFSLLSALGMVALGATRGSATQQQLLGGLGLTASSAPVLFQELRDISARLAASTDVAFQNGNSIWCKNSIKQSYLSEVESTFNAQALALPSSPDVINKWVEKQTHGMIPSIIHEIDPLTVAVLVNAVFFKGQWKTKFDSQFSVPGLFQSKGSGSQPCVMMKREDKNTLYAEDVDGSQVVELPYGNGTDVAAVVILPPRDKEKDGSGRPSLAALLTGNARDDRAAARAWSDLVGKLVPTHVSLQLPRFKLDFGIKDLKSELELTFGIESPFGPSASFQHMSNDPNVHLSHVFHKAVVEVNEEGTKAAAATAAVMTRAAVVVPIPPKMVIVDRPFFFLGP